MPSAAKSVIAVFALTLVSCVTALWVDSVLGNSPPCDGIVPSHPGLIAHAGGGVDGMTYTNSLQALDLNYALGHRFFEIDLIWSSDEYLVLLHDWGEAGPVTRDAFLRGSTRGDLTSLTIDDLVAWLVEHPDAYLVSDVKIGNLAALHFLRFRYPHLCNRVIPQIYRGAEFDVVADLGFRHIILTLYRSELDDDEVVEFAAEHSLFAVTMPTRRALSSNLTDRLHEVGVAVYAHTVNDVDTVQDLMQRGVTGVYTDFLRPPK